MLVWLLSRSLGSFAPIARLFVMQRLLIGRVLDLFFRAGQLVWVGRLSLASSWFLACLFRFKVGLIADRVIGSNAIRFRHRSCNFLLSLFWSGTSLTTFLRFLFEDDVACLGLTRFLLLPFTTFLWVGFLILMLLIFLMVCSFRGAQVLFVVIMDLAGCGDCRVTFQEVLIHVLLLILFICCCRHATSCPLRLFYYLGRSSGVIIGATVEQWFEFAFVLLRLLLNLLHW